MDRGIIAWSWIVPRFDRAVHLPKTSVYLCGVQARNQQKITERIPACHSVYLTPLCLTSGPIGTLRFRIPALSRSHHAKHLRSRGATKATGTNARWQNDNKCQRKTTSPPRDYKQTGSGEGRSAVRGTDTCCKNVVSVACSVKFRPTVAKLPMHNVER